MRKIMVTGFLAADAQKQISKQNREYVSLNLANREYNDPKGADGLTQTTWIRVTSFNPQLNTFASNLKKGSNVTVIGDVRVSTYQNRMGGTSVDVDVIADSINYTSAGDGGNRNNNNSAPTTVNYSRSVNNTSYNPQASPQATMPTATSMPTTAPTTPTVTPTDASGGEDDDLPF